ncbi:uncharacterized protein B0H18DRAFT_593282 [Fomitopsis serialis]|uniref:uncharacterized protein n=1 Tax=Fomitopsis serialis TaxID=139415 RepID=UPI0020076181|nr:uncharacterized protein B0H18DRAFT_593282 [Neoantrodia serialis]KAH9920449.1 hypothetical protein B0H18DRAFT_593282 [Neoantrodia serialis]
MEPIYPGNFDRRRRNVHAVPHPNTFGRTSLVTMRHAFGASEACITRARSNSSRQPNSSYVAGNSTTPAGADTHTGGNCARHSRFGLVHTVSQDPHCATNTIGNVPPTSSSGTRIDYGRSTHSTVQSLREWQLQYASGTEQTSATNASSQARSDVYSYEHRFPDLDRIVTESRWPRDDVVMRLARRTALHQESPEPSATQISQATRWPTHTSDTPQMVAMDIDINHGFQHRYPAQFANEHYTSESRGFGTAPWHGSIEGFRGNESQAAVRNPLDNGQYCDIDTFTSNTFQSSPARRLPPPTTMVQRPLLAS